MHTPQMNIYIKCIIVSYERLKIIDLVTTEINPYNFEQILF